MKTNLRHLLLLASAPIIIASCHKNNNDDDVVDVTTLKKDILTDAAQTVISTSYSDMDAKATALQTAVSALNTTTNPANLKNAQDAWKGMRTTWEQTESWLFGPVETDDIDPRIDTWPVDFNNLNAQLSSGNAFTESYIDGLDDDLKGFHPIEFLLWGQNGTKAATDFTAREKEYLVALTANLVKLTNQVKVKWTTGGYASQLQNAGANGNTEFPTVQEAYITLVDAMAGICDEVANAKIKDPFDAQDPTQEESPFAKNSITDFTNNINGIIKIYQGQFTQDGKGIEDLVKNYNRSLDNEIKEKHAAAIASLNAISAPFGTAISTQQSQVQTAMIKINELAATLETKLRPFVLQYAN